MLSAEGHGMKHCETLRPAGVGLETWDGLTETATLNETMTLVLVLN